MAKNARIAFFIVCDFVCFNASYLLAYIVNSAFGEAGLSAADAVSAYSAVYVSGFLILIIVKLIAMYVFSVYRILFDYAGPRDFQRVALSLVASTLAAVTAAVILGIEPVLLTGVIVLSFFFDMALALAVRFLYVRLAAVRAGSGDTEGQSLRRRYEPQRKSAGRVMVIGANRAVADLITEMQENENEWRKVEIIIDDDKSYEGDTIHGIEIVSGRNEIRQRARRQGIDEIIIAKPTASKKQIASLLRDCVKTRCKIRMLPRAKARESATATPSAALADLRKPTVSDLLGRDRPRVDHREIGDHLKGRVVLVTGGAGAFGSELCRRIILYRPRRLIALDIDEDGLAMLNAELEGFRTAETEFRTVVASVRDMIMMRRAFAAFRPHIVFHAAELKQIPIAQANPRETFLTNVLGLKNACDLADEYAAEKFILCSTVRAAEPTNVAAECKRTAELYIAEKNVKSRTSYATVRFPNLIEGRGNVVALFSEQIKYGGPLTVTDKDIMRRFISAEEAALLTIKATVLAAGGEIFELGPGEPIGIRDLAEAMVRLEGRMPYEEIDIAITQLRPGERLFDEVGDEGPHGDATGTEHIWVLEDRSGAKLPHWSQLWRQDPERMDDAAVMELLRLIFPTYKIKRPGTTMRGEKIEYEQGD
ncbi:MAG: polysaccharide biosynthesis protein [Clostridiales bacterium]|nr:polysaccharide biosynthesis protein [Clostridiales bacterium]